MALYRVLKRLSRNETVIESGDITDLGWLGQDDVKTLVDIAAVSRLAPPPLEVLPGWKTRAKRFSNAGIEDAEAFLEASDEEIATVVRAKPATIKKWKKEVLSFLVVPSNRDG